jgi:hypothetical protein
MKVIAKEAYRHASEPNEEIRFGIASWDDGSNTAFSVKLAWRDRTGKVCRGGEVPIGALDQMQAIVRRNSHFLARRQRRGQR